MKRIRIDQARKRRSPLNEAIQNRERDALSLEEVRAMLARAKKKGGRG